MMVAAWTLAALACLALGLVAVAVVVASVVDLFDPGVDALRRVLGLVPGGPYNERRKV